MVSKQSKSKNKSLSAVPIVIAAEHISDAIISTRLITKKSFISSINAKHFLKMYIKNVFSNYRWMIWSIYWNSCCGELQNMRDLQKIRSYIYKNLNKYFADFLQIFE